MFSIKIESTLAANVALFKASVFVGDTLIAEAAEAAPINGPVNSNNVAASALDLAAKLMKGTENALETPSEPPARADEVTPDSQPAAVPAGVQEAPECPEKEPGDVSAEPSEVPEREAVASSEEAVKAEPAKAEEPAEDPVKENEAEADTSVRENPMPAPVKAEEPSKAPEMEHTATAVEMPKEDAAVSKPVSGGVMPSGGTKFLSKEDAVKVVLTVKPGVTPPSTMRGKLGMTLGELLTTAPSLMRYLARPVSEKYFPEEVRLAAKALA